VKPSEFTVSSPESGQTITAFLKVKLGLPWSKAKALVESGQVKINGQKITDVATRIKTGKIVQVGTAPTRSSEKIRSSEKVRSSPPSDSTKKKALAKSRLDSYTGPLPSLVYADEHIAVFDKPSGLTSTRTAEELRDFSERERAYLPVTLQELAPRLLGSAGRQIFPVHRIDRETSGLIIMALKQSAKKNLEEQFREHSISRLYLALTRGVPSTGKIESHFVADRGDGRRGSSKDGSGQRAVTFVKLLHQSQGYGLVECRLETGRTHQVRIHLGEMGCPLCGEKIYDRPLHKPPLPDASQAKRVMLHARTLGIEHPETKEWMEWTSPLPEDFQTLAKSLGFPDLE
jgi:23S rRNA pseudouridine1911/1915/1917 synthase